MLNTYFIAIMETPRFTPRSKTETSPELSVVSRARPFTQYEEKERVWSSSRMRLVLHCQHKCNHCGNTALITR